MTGSSAYDTVSRNACPELQHARIEPIQHGPGVSHRGLYMTETAPRSCSHLMLFAWNAWATDFRTMRHMGCLVFSEKTFSS